MTESDPRRRRDSEPRRGLGPCPEALVGLSAASPHLPPEQYCTMSSAMAPAEKPKQIMNPSSQALKKC